jgi:gliding motility-associated-like protein
MKPIITHLLSGVKMGSIFFVLLATFTPFKAFSSNSPATIGDNEAPVKIVAANESLMGFSLSISNVTVQKAGEFCAQVKVSGFVDILGLEFLLKFDSTRLTFKEVKNFNLAGLSAATMGLPGAGSNPTGTLKVSWLDNNVAGVTVVDGTAIFDICFTAVNLDATTNLRFVYKEVVDKNEKNVVVNTTTPQTVVTIGAGGTNTGGSGGTLALDITDVTATAANQEVCVKVNTVSGFTNLKGMQFSIAYNSTQLDYVSVKNFNLAGLTVANFTQPGVGANPAGTLGITWTSTTPTTGTTVAAAIAIFEVCFKGKSAGITSTVSFGTTATIQNKDNQAVTLNGTTGVITVNGPPTTGPATFDIGDATATTVGQEVCQKVTVTNFTSLLSTEYILTYNSTQLEFSAIKNLNLDGLTDASFSKPGVGGTPLGSIKLSWNDPQVSAGVSVPNGTAIFEVCFKPKLNNITSTVTFGATSEIINKDGQPVTFTGLPGSITVGTGTGGLSGFTLDLTDATVPATNQEVCIKVNTGNGFTNMVGMEFTIAYNSTQLDFSAVKNFTLAGLTEASFGLPGVGTNPIGSIKVSWSDPNVTGITLANGTALLDVCFKAKLTNIVSSVTFATTPPPEAIDKDNTQLQFTGLPGQITVGSVVTTPDVQLNVGSQSGTVGQDVCVKVNAVDFTNISAVAGILTYDVSALQFKSVTNLNLSGLTQASFTTPGNGGVTAGTLKLNWSTATVGGVSVGNNTAIFEVCFTALKAVSSQVSFSSTGLIVTRSNTQTAVVQRGVGTISANLANTTDLTLKVSSASGATNTDVCLELTTTNFKNVIGMQYAIKFDPAFLTHKTFDNFNAGLRGFSSGSVNANNTSGFISLSWVDDQIAGVTLPDNAVIMRMCFTIKGTSGSSNVGIDKTKVVELTDVNEKAIKTQTQDGTVTIGVANAPTIVSPAVITNVPCFGESKGAINIEIRGGTGTYTYRWSNNATTQDLSNLAAGSYNVTVTDSGNAATVTGTFSITQPSAAVTITGITKTDVSCFGLSTGALNAAATGGTAPLAYAWSGNLAAVANPTNVPVGSYTLTVTDANGCRAVSNPTAVTQPAAALAATTNTVAAKCDGTPTGSATITATGGVGPYTYKWGGNNQTTTQLSNIAAGTYAYTVTDSKSCIFSSAVTVTQEQTVRITSIDPVNFDQNTSNGAVNIALNGGVAPYRFSWTGPSPFTATTEDISNLGTAGQYCVTVTDNAGCTATMCASIVQRLKVNPTITEACFGQNTGGVNLQVTGGVGPYTYRWSSNNATTQNITNIAAGNYNVTVTDSQNNTVTGNALVPALTEIKIGKTITDVNTPGGTNGGVTLTVTGGKPGYTYRWNNNSTAASLSGLVVGDYCVTVTDLAGCTATGCFKIDLVTVPLSVSPDITGNRCNGESTGSARLQVNGGVAPYILTFNNGQPENLSGNTFERKNLAAGNYTYKITDSRNTVIDGSVVVTQPDPLTISSFAVRHDAEDAGCTGSIALSITGGTPGYQVSWNAPNVGFQIINLCEGNFIPSVIDANGCRKTFEPIVLTTFTLSATVKNTSCPDDKDGGVDLRVIGGAAPYRFAWLSARGDTITKTEDLGDVTAGVYRLVVSENSGNRIEKQYTVSTASKLTASVQILSSFNGFAVSCAEAKDGSARATGVNGGGTGYVYEWLLNNTLVVAAQNLTNAGIGNYIIRITDGLGCSIEEDVELKAPTKLDANAFITDVSCIGSRDGEIAAEVDGGVTGGKFIYAWSNGRSTPRVTSLAKGSYSLTITDRNNCTVAKTFEVKEPAAIAVTIQSINATEGCNGQVLAQAKGGVRPYTYRWNAPVTSGDSLVKSLCPGDYFVQVTDSRGCKSTPEVNAIEVKDRRLPCMDIRAVISPDGDGSNEEFLINCIQEFPGNKISIYNRWGQLVYQAENYNNDWKGTTQSGELLPEGAYFYVLAYKNSDGKDIQAKGSITLLREE